MVYSYGATAAPAPSTGPYLLTATSIPAVGGSIGINPVSADGTYPAGTVVNLTATPAAGYTFIGWTGEVANTGSTQTTVTMNEAQVISANFIANSTIASGGTAGNTAGTNFGPGSVGSAATPQLLTFNFYNDTTLSAVSILTNGAPNLDYTDGGGSTCVAGTAYSAGQTCTVTVAFTPSLPGLRSGAVVLFAAGNTLPLQTFYLTGVGLASAATIDPGTESVLTTLSNAGNASGTALDGAGNLYVSDSVNAQILSIAAGSLSQTTLVPSGLLNPTALALDGAGNLYVSDTGNQRVIMIPNEQGVLSPADLSAITISGLGTPGSLAIDAVGDLFVADTANGAVTEVPAGGGNAPFTVVSGINQLQSIAVDGNANLYIAAANLVTEYPAGGGSPNPIGTGFNKPLSVAVDASGSVYVSDAERSAIIIVAPGGGSQVTVPTGINNPSSLLLDSAANFYLTSGSSLYEINRTSSVAVSFANTSVNAISPPQTLTVTDAGNQPLTIASLALSGSFSQGTLGSSDCASGIQLAAATQCPILLNFVPTVTGPSTGTLTLVDNAVVAAGTQVIQLAGVGSYLSQTITFPAISSQIYGGSPISLAATATSGLPIAYAVVAGPASVSGNVLTTTDVGTITVQATQAGNSFYSAATSVTQKFTVSQATQTITFAPVAAQIPGSSITLNATASSQLQVSISTTTPSVCSIAGSVVNFNIAGTCTVVVTQGGDAEYKAAGSVARNITVSQVGQSISFAAPTSQAVGATFAPVLTATSGLPVTLSSTTPATCTVTSNVVTTIAAGTCTLQATQPGNVEYKPANPVNQSFSVAQIAQTITFNGISTQAPTATVQLSASSTSQLPVTFSTTTPSVCSISGTTLTTNTVGLCSVVAAQPGNAQYRAATSVTKSFNVIQTAQTITFTPIAAQTVGAVVNLTPTATSGLPVTLVSTNPVACSVSGLAVTATGAGTCTLQATQSGNSQYAAAPTITQSFVVSQLAQSITFPSITGQQVGVTITPTVSASSTLPVSLASMTAATCSAIGNSVTTLAAGTCSVQATQPGNTLYKAASPVTVSFAVSQIAQTINFAAVATQFPTQVSALTVTATSQLPVTITSTTPNICSVVNSTLSSNAIGVCTLVASQAGNATYKAAASVTKSISVSLVSQTIAFSAVPAQAVGATLNLSPTATSGLVVSLVAVNPAICSVSGNLVTTIAAGTCSLQATQTGNAQYAAATSVTQSFAVTQSAQTITFPSISAQTVGALLTLSPTASSGLPVTLTALTAGTCSASGFAITTIAAGTCTVQATQTGNAQYKAAAAVNESFAVSQIAQTITFSLASTSYPGASVVLAATATSQLPVTFSTSTPAVCSISGTNLTFNTTGACSVVAAQAGNAQYKAAPSIASSVNVSQAGQSITFPSISGKYVGTTTTLTATSTSGLVVTLTATTPLVCTLNGNSLTTIAAGACSVTASQAGNGPYKAASPVTRGFTVGQVSQTITFSAIGTQSVGTILSPNLSASSGLAVTLTSATPAVCSANGTTISTLAAGTCTITASQAGNAQYRAATAVNQSFAVH